MNRVHLTSKLIKYLKLDGVQESGAELLITIMSRERTSLLRRVRDLGVEYKAIYFRNFVDNNQIR